MSSAKHPSSPTRKETVTDQEFEEVLTGGAFDEEERLVIRQQRDALTKRGITREPMRTRMACEFAEVILRSRSRR